MLKSQFVLFVLTVALALTFIFFASVTAADSPVTKDVVKIENPKTLGAKQLTVERVPVGIYEDYKPHLIKLANGELLLTGLHAPVTGGVAAEYCFLYRSSDGGRTWSDRQQLEILGRESFLSMISDGTLFISTHVIPGARGNNEGYSFCYLYRSTDEAPNGDILSVKRVASKFYPAIPNTQIPRGTSDQYERMVLYRSKDAGRNWSYEELGSHYGEMYPSILRLQDGRLLFTFTMRTAVKPNVLPLGLRAVIGTEKDDGFTFDFRHDRILLDTQSPANLSSGGGFGTTVQLDDGTLVSTCSYSTPENTTRCEAIRWRAPK